MTGVELNRYFEREIFKAYSVYYNGVKTNDLFRKALIVSIQERYEHLLNQTGYDALSGMIKVNKVFGLNKNQVHIAPLDILTIVHTVDFALTTKYPHNVAVGDSVTLVNVAGFSTSVNGVQVVTKVTDDFIFEFAAVFTAGVHTANTGQINAHTLNKVDKMVADYNHLLAVKAKYELKLLYSVKNVTNTEPVKVLIDTINNNIVSGETINISGVLKNTNANGNYFVKKVNRKTFSLYKDEALSIPVSGNGAFEGLPILKRVFYNYATPLVSIEKINESDQSTIKQPMFERGEKFVIIAPAEEICLEITMDYLTNATVFIDVADAVIDLSDTYPDEFLYYIITKAVQLYSSEVNDKDRYAASTVEIKEDK